MSSFFNSFDKDFKEKRVIKVITGISNTNVYQISKIAKAAELANASYLDVVANTQVVKFLKSFSSLPICVSSIETIDIYNCLAAGADIVEIGIILSITLTNGQWVLVCDTTLTSSQLPTSSDFISFSKDNTVNLTSVLGYYAETKFVNSSFIKSELYSVGSDYFESSK